MKVKNKCCKKEIYNYLFSMGVLFLIILFIIKVVLYTIHNFIHPLTTTSPIAAMSVKVIPYVPNYLILFSGLTLAYLCWDGNEKGVDKHVKRKEF